jgi:hypothetical protein
MRESQANFAASAPRSGTRVVRLADARKQHQPRVRQHAGRKHDGAGRLLVLDAVSESM